MDHGHRISVRRSHHVDLLMNPFQRLLRNHHGKNGGSGGNIARAHPDAVGGHHTGSGVSLGRAHGNTCLKDSGRIQKLCSLFRQRSGLFSGTEHPGQNLLQLPGISHIRRQLSELIHHPPVIIPGRGIDGKHAGGLSHAQHLLSGQLPVNISRQGGQKRNILYMLLSLQHSLIQMGDAPPLGNIEMKHRRQLSAGLLRHGISPGAEGRKQTALPVKGHIAVHHAGKTHTANGSKLHTVFLLHFPGQLPIAALESLPDVLQTVGPDAVFQPVLPVMVSHGNRLMTFIHQHGLDPGGTKLNTQRRPALPDGLFDFFAHLPSSSLSADTRPFILMTSCFSSHWFSRQPGP